MASSTTPSANASSVYSSLPSSWNPILGPSPISPIHADTSPPIRESNERVSDSTKYDTGSRVVSQQQQVSLLVHSRFQDGTSSPRPCLSPPQLSSPGFYPPSHVQVRGVPDAQWYRCPLLIHYIYPDARLLGKIPGTTSNPEVSGTCQKRPSDAHPEPDLTGIKFLPPCHPYSSLSLPHA